MKKQDLCLILVLQCTLIKPKQVKRQTDVALKLRWQVGLLPGFSQLGTRGKLTFSGGLNTTFGTFLSEKDNDRELEINPGGSGTKLPSNQCSKLWLFHLGTLPEIW